MNRAVASTCGLKTTVSTVLSVLVLLSLLSLASCAGHTPGNRPELGPMAVMVMETEPADVDIFVDGAWWGTTADAPNGAVPVPANAKRLELRADGFFPHRRDLDLHADQSYTLRVRLVRDLH